jgi:hypothetical protein
VSLKEAFPGQDGFLADMELDCGISAEIVWDPVYVVVSDTTQGEIHSSKVILYEVVWFSCLRITLPRTHARILIESRSDHSEPRSAFFGTVSKGLLEKCVESILASGRRGPSHPRALPSPPRFPVELSR